MSLNSLLQIGDLDLTEEEAILIGLSHYIFYEKGIELNLSGNKVYYTNSSILPVKNMLCSYLHLPGRFSI